MNTERFNILFNRYMEQTATADEEKELMVLLADPSNETESKNLIENYWLNWPEKYDLSESQWGSLYSDIQQAIKPAKRVKMYFWRRIAVAASIILVVGVGAYLAIVGVFSNKKQTEVVQTEQQRFKNDVQPGKNGAILTLDNGQQIILDSVHNGLIAQQGNSDIVKKGEQLSYNSNQKQTVSTVVYNTITTTRGKQYPDLILADGSKVWLDASSSIRFPTSFTGSERVVEITGQVWFDVRHNDKMPFKVIAKGIVVNDLGTEFNVNSYEDEGANKITLIAGKIEVVASDKKITIQPGQQVIFGNDNLTVNKNVNVDEVMAWKNGYFQSDNATVQSVMKQLARWYDVDIVYEKPITKRMSLLGVPRTVTLVNILKIVETTGNVKFKIDGKTVTVIP